MKSMIWSVEPVKFIGAATSILHGHCDPTITAMILDSSFAGFTQLAMEYCLELFEI